MTAPAPRLPKSVGALVAGVMVAFPVVRGFIEWVINNEVVMVGALIAIGAAATAALGPIGLIIAVGGAIVGAVVLIAGANEQAAEASREAAAAQRELDLSTNVLAGDLELLAGGTVRARTEAESLELAIHRMRMAQADVGEATNQTNQAIEVAGVRSTRAARRDGRIRAAGRSHGLAHGRTPNGRFGGRTGRRNPGRRRGSRG